MYLAKPTEGLGIHSILVSIFLHSYAAPILKCVEHMTDDRSAVNYKKYLNFFSSFLGERGRQAANPLLTHIYMITCVHISSSIDHDD